MKRSTKQKIATYKWLQRHAPRLSKKDAYDLMEWANENGYIATMIWKIPSKEYRKWYKKNKKHLKTTITEETTFEVSSDNKAFKPGALGYSIFAYSFGDMQRNDGKPWYYREVERIERCDCEYAILVGMTRKE